MANLTGQRITVPLVHVNSITRNNLCMAIDTLWIFRAAQAMFSRGGLFCHAVQFRAFMTFHTAHACLTEMHIPWIAFILSEEFIPNAAAVTGRAGAGHRRSCFKHMACKQAAAHIFRLADMALTTSGVAGRAMIAEHFLQLCVIFRHIAVSGIDGCPIARLRIM